MTPRSWGVAGRFS